MENLTFRQNRNRSTTQEDGYGPISGPAGTRRRRAVRVPAGRINTTLLLSLFAVMILLRAVPAWASYPEIRVPANSDELYRQHQDGVQEFYRKERSGEVLPPLVIYRYRPGPDDTLFTLAARFNIPYSTLSSVNRIDGSAIPDERESLLIPGVPGLFIPAEPATDLENLIFDRIRPDLREGAVTVRLQKDTGNTTFYFLPGEDFAPEERLSFLQALFRTPLDAPRISSRYGYRQNPFTGRSRFHTGVDLAAPAGTPVYAARSGTVTESGYDLVFGHYLVLSHGSGYESFYGHLETKNVELNQTVSSGMIIATVGMSGLSTGPHLHFEIRLNGQTRDPLQLLPGQHQ